MDVIRLLLDAGVNPNPQLNMHRPGRGGNSSRFVDDLLTTGATPLLRAAIGHDAAAVRALLEHGALVDLAERDGRDAAHGRRGRGCLAARPASEPRWRRADARARDARGADRGRRGRERADHGHRRPDRAHRAHQHDDGAQRTDRAVRRGEVRLDAGRAIPARARGEDRHRRRARQVAAQRGAGQTGGRDNTVSQEIADLIRKAGNGA